VRAGRCHNSTDGIGCRIALRSPPSSVCIEPTWMVGLACQARNPGEEASLSIKVLQLTAIPLRFIAAGELGH
jgi:hypothetical protein